MPGQAPSAEGSQPPGLPPFCHTRPRVRGEGVLKAQRSGWAIHLPLAIQAHLQRGHWAQMAWQYVTMLGPCHVSTTARQLSRCIAAGSVG